MCFDRTRSRCSEIKEELWCLSSLHSSGPTASYLRLPLSFSPSSPPAENFTSCLFYCNTLENGLSACTAAQLQPVLCTEKRLVFPQCNLVLFCVIVCEGGANIYSHSHMYCTLLMKRWNLFPLLNLGLMTWFYQQKYKWWEWYFGTFKPQGLETTFYFPSFGSQLPWKVVQARLLDKSQIKRHHPTFCSIRWMRPYEHSSPRDLEFSSPGQVAPASNT